MMMAEKSPATKQVAVAATETKVNDINLKNRDSKDQYLPPSKYSGSIYKMLSLKQKDWLWQDCKKAKGNWEDKLRMMGVTIDSAAHTYGDNMSAIKIPLSQSPP